MKTQQWKRKTYEEEDSAPVHTYNWGPYIVERIDNRWWLYYRGNVLGKYRTLRIAKDVAEFIIQMEVG